MNSEPLQSKWNQLRSNIKTNFGKLTDEDLLQADGDVDKIESALQQRYGYTKTKAQSEWHKFARDYEEKGEEVKGDLESTAADVKAAARHIKDVVRRSL